MLAFDIGNERYDATIYNKVSPECNDIHITHYVNECDPYSTPSGPDSGDSGSALLCYRCENRGSVSELALFVYDSVMPATGVSGHEGI